MKGFIPTRVAVALALALLGLATLALEQAPAFAEQPMISRLDINETDNVETVCDFPLIVQQEGTLMTTLFFDEQSGEITRITQNWQNVRSTLTNPANGLSVTFRNAGHEGFTFENDGDIRVFRQGVRGLITVPGVGATFGEAGNVTAIISPDGQIETSVSGFQWEGDATAVCEYLRGDQ